MHRRIVLTAVIALMVAGNAAAKDRKLGQYSGFEGNEEVLGAAVAEAIMEVSPTKGPEHDFSTRSREMGLAVATAIKTFNAESVYVHEMNDALVKATLTQVQFAKDRDLLDDLVEEEVRIQSPMLMRVNRMIEKTGNKELALIAVTEQTACFYQLVADTQREPGKITYRSPYGRVLEQTRRLGQHDLTEQEIHERWTIPRFNRYAEILGVDLQISEWRDDGLITISLPETRVAAAP